MSLLKVKKIHCDASIPVYASKDAAGMDIAYPEDEDIIIEPNNTAMVPTGIAIALPKGYEAQIRPRSGLALKHHVTVLNSPGTIDADYRGEIKVILINHGTQNFTVTKNMRIAQMVISKHEYLQIDLVESLDQTQRNAGGFGSTGFNNL